MYFKIYKIGLTKGVFENLLRLRNLNSDYIVKLYDIWLEDDFQFVQMELSRCNLKDFMMAKSTFFSRQFREPMCETEYFVSWWIWKQLIECIDYIHDQGLIHCSLNPSNILISTNNNGRFIKVGEFSTSMTVNSESNNNAERGSGKYMAIEIYNQMVDVYRIATIAFELFVIYRLNETIIKQLYDGTNLEKYMVKLHDYIKNRITIDNNEQPNVKKILSDIQEYSINDKITNYKKNDLLGLINEYIDSILMSTSTQLTRQFKKFKLESNLIYKGEDRLSEFTTCERIGYGNYGKVMKVFHNVTKKYYALKKIYIKGKPYCRLNNFLFSKHIIFHR